MKTPDIISEALNSFHNYDGMPYKGPVMSFKDNDIEDRKPNLKYEFHVNQFDLSKEKHLSKYTEVNNNIANGDAILSYEEKVYDNDIKSWRILVAWSVPYYGAPKSTQNKTDITKKKGNL